MSTDAALVFQDPAHPASSPGTHVLIVGVGRYTYGKGAGASPVGADLPQLTSPPVSARAIADWFITSFRNAAKPLASVSLLISEDAPQPYQPLRPAGAAPVTLRRSTLGYVKEAAQHWADRLKSHQDNVAVFYFCGHGASQGQRAALLLDDFGNPASAFDDAIDLDVLRGTMKNSPAIQQVYMLDCCRTKADEIYQNEPAIGSRVLSVPAFQRGHTTPPQQFVLFPTIDGEQAFGLKNEVSVFTRSIIDAVGFAAADNTTGAWKTTTGTLLATIDRLVALRLPPNLRSRSKPNALDATSFDFNEIDEPALACSLVTISDLALWGQVQLETSDLAGANAPQTKHTKDVNGETCCAFKLPEGRWRFTGTLPTNPPTIQEHERTVRLPVAYVTLEVTR